MASGGDLGDADLRPSGQAAPNLAKSVRGQEEAADKLLKCRISRSRPSLYFPSTWFSAEVKRPTNHVTSIFCSVSAITEAIEIPQFIGRSYLTYDKPDILKR